MEIVDPSELAKHHHVWLTWLGLEEPPPDAGDWVAVARGFLPDSTTGQSSRLAAHLIGDLVRAGIDARQRLYEFYNGDAGVGVGVFGLASRMETCVAVVVHDRDLLRAVDVANGVKAELNRQADEPLAGELSDAELTRDALQAGPPPPD